MKIRNIVYSLPAKLLGVLLCILSAPLVATGIMGQYIETLIFQGDMSVREWSQSLVDTGFAGDLLYARSIVNYLVNNRIVYLVGGCLLFLLTVFYLAFVAGHHPGTDEVKINAFDRVPLVFLVLGWMIIAFSALTLLANFAGDAIGSVDASFYLLVCLTFFYAGYCFTMAFVLSLVRRIKAHAFLSTTMISYIINFFRKHGDRLPLHRLFHRIHAEFQAGNDAFEHAMIIIAICTFFELIGLLVLIPGSGNSGTVLLVWLVYRLITLPLALWAVLQWRTLSRGIKKLADGNVERPISDEVMFADLRVDADNLNRVSDSVRLAVDERLKSERLKTELITNVSHDIKTPLTSIINYVDLLDKEMENPTEKEKEYLEILTRQSNRLKKLIQDLIDASKATTGNVEVKKEAILAGVILNQAMGEFEEKLKDIGLEICVGEQLGEKRVLADGRHLWRVFDNLLSNICKYAQPGTRVYVDAEEVRRENAVWISIVFRNISREKLNISPDELMERFTRGDSSRNTEGSGLGLNIANSLLELMDGKLEIEIDGDLFKARVLLKEV